MDPLRKRNQPRIEVVAPKQVINNTLVRFDESAEQRRVTLLRIGRKRDQSLTEQGRIPGAVNIPLDELGDRLAEIPKDVPVVVGCAHGVRSIYGSQIIRFSGIPEVYNLEGGTMAWWMRHLPLES